MGTTEKQTTGTSLAKTATQDPSISDYRKSTRTFAVLAKGLNLDTISDACSAMAFDNFTGKLDLEPLYAYRDLMAIQIKLEDQAIARLDLNWRLETVGRSAKRVKARRELLER